MEKIDLSRRFPHLPAKYLMVVAARNDLNTECGFGLAATAASCNHLQPLECMGETGEIYLFIVVICRQWVFLMRNICFCVFPENIIPLWKWYSHPFQQHRKENMGFFLSFICFSLGHSHFPGTLWLWHLFFFYWLLCSLLGGGGGGKGELEVGSLIRWVTVPCYARRYLNLHSNKSVHTWPWSVRNTEAM